MENVNLLGEPTNVVDLDKIAEEIRNNTGQRNYRQCPTAFQSSF